MFYLYKTIPVLLVLRTRLLSSLSTSVLFENGLSLSLPVKQLQTEEDFCLVTGGHENHETNLALWTWVWSWTSPLLHKVFRRYVGSTVDPEGEGPFRPIGAGLGFVVSDTAVFRRNVKERTRLEKEVEWRNTRDGVQLRLRFKTGRWFKMFWVYVVKKTLESNDDFYRPRLQRPTPRVGVSKDGRGSR